MTKTMITKRAVRYRLARAVDKWGMFRFSMCCSTIGMLGAVALVFATSGQDRYFRPRPFLTYTAAVYLATWLIGGLIWYLHNRHIRHQVLLHTHDELARRRSRGYGYER